MLRFYAGADRQGSMALRAFRLSILPSLMQASPHPLCNEQPQTLTANPSVCVRARACIYIFKCHPPPAGAMHACIHMCSLDNAMCAYIHMCSLDDAMHAYIPMCSLDDRRGAARRLAAWGNSGRGMQGPWDKYHGARFGCKVRPVATLVAAVKPKWVCKALHMLDNSALSCPGAHCGTGE